MKILLFRGRGLIASLIKFQTRSEYSHAAICLGDSRVVEATYVKGVNTSPTLTGFKGAVDTFEVETTPTQDAVIEQFLVQQVGKLYDLTMCIRFFTRKQATRKTKGRWFCSELVFAAFQAAGIDLFKQTEPWAVSPGMLARSPLMKLVGSIKI